MENVNDASEFFRGKKCIWMEADVVAYKLCDKNYDCEKCSFDFVMRNTWQERTDQDQIMNRFVNNSLIDKVIHNISRLNYADEYTYLKNQLVLKHMFGGVYSIGLNDLLPAVMENIDVIKIISGYGIVKKNDLLLEIEGKWGKKNIVAPMSFTLLQKLNINPDDLPEDNWFGVISVSESELSSAKILIETSRLNSQHLIARLYNYMKTAPEAGATMLDGGTKCNYLYEVLGNEEFGKILSDFL